MFEKMVQLAERNVFPQPLQNIPAQILVFDNIGKSLAYVCGVHDKLLAFPVRRGKADLVEHAFHDRMQPPRPNIFRALIHPERKARNLFQGVFRKLQLHALGLEQRGVLLN